MKKPMHEARLALTMHPRCGAYCRTTGEPCKNPAMKNGRCRMHGGKSTGRPATHGRTTLLKKNQYAEVRRLSKILSDLTAKVKS